MDENGIAAAPEGNSEETWDSVDFGLSPELTELEHQARKVATDVLRPSARQAETEGGWPDEAITAFESLGTRSLLLSPSLGGDGEPEAAVVALEAFAWGDAGGLCAVDTPGPASVALWVADGSPPSSPAARELASSCLRDSTVVALSVGLDDAGSAQRLSDADARAPRSWAPGGDAPAALISVMPGRIAIHRGDALHAERVDATACHASGGMSVTTQNDPSVVVIGSEGAFAARAGARLWVSAVLTGIASAALDLAIAYGRERVVFGTPVLGHQANSFEVAAAATDVEGARIATRAAASRFGDAYAGKADTASAAWASTIAYLQAREAALRATDLGVQLLGGHGYMADHLCEKWWREARMLALLLGGHEAALADAAGYVNEVSDPMVVG